MSPLMVTGTHSSIGQHANHGRNREAIQLMFGGAVDTLMGMRRMEGNGNPNVRILERVSRFDGIKPDIHMNESFLGDWCFTTVPNFDFNQCDRFPQSNLVAKVPQ